MKTGIVVCGGGPAGLSAAITAAFAGTKVVLLERNGLLGGQLVKQTHKFFGSEREYAGVRGVDIAAALSEKVEAMASLIEVRRETTLSGVYSDGSLLLERNGATEILYYGRLIVATGAAETLPLFAGNDLPGIYGAGAVQTLMNLHGVLPGKRAVMVGAGNIGLIVAFQLLQAGVEIAAVIEAAPRIGGYLVHASKLRRAGVPILCSTTVMEAHGSECLEGITTARLDGSGDSVPDTEERMETDLLCLATGLSPLVELLWHAGCEMRYIPELGGYVPLRDRGMATTAPGIYVAGDAGGVEEASTAAVRDLGVEVDGLDRDAKRARERLEALRGGARGKSYRKGLEKARIPAGRRPA
jgi:sarcosine oxidase subunit alpha